MAWAHQGETVAFSAKTDYGLVALMDLATAYTSGERVQTAEICRRHHIPERYLEQLLTALRKGGYLKSSRGPRGGFQLSRPPDAITVAEIEACLEGDGQAVRQGDKQDPEFQALTSLGQRVSESRSTILQQTTLAHLLADRDRFREPAPMFYI